MTEHERIIREKISDAELHYAEFDKYPQNIEYDFIEAMFKMLQENKAYEDAEEQGLLLRLPCKVGDKVWIITSPANYSLGRYAEVVLKQPQEKKIHSITICKNGIAYHVKDRTYGIYDFGKTVFLTREEAEQALAELKGGTK